MSKGKIALIVVLSIILLGLVAFGGYFLGQKSNKQIPANPLPTSASTPSQAPLTQEDIDNEANSIADEAKSETTDSKTYQANYDRIINQYKTNVLGKQCYSDWEGRSDEYWKEISYSIYDIDGNGTPELILHGSSSDSSSLDALYTFDNDKQEVVNLLGNAGLASKQPSGNIFAVDPNVVPSATYLLSDGLYFVPDGTSDVSDFTQKWYKLIGTKLYIQDLLQAYVNWDNSDSPNGLYTYYLNNVEISAADAEKKMATSKNPFNKGFIKITK